jgi:Fe-S-cluster containining protein
MSRPDCLACGACCKVDLVVEVIRGLDQVPLDYMEPIIFDGEEIWAMRKKNGVCLAYDLKKKKCKIYKIRPMVCAQFSPGCRCCQIAIDIASRKTS